MIQRRNRLPRVLHVRIRHRGIFSHDVHAANLASLGRVDDLDDGQSGFRVELHLPQGLKPLPGRLRSHGLVIGVDHRNESRVGRALDVVLSAQRMQPGAGLPDLPGRERQGDQTAGVVGSVNVLGNSHAPQDD